jgi:hypothetical protein
MFGLGFVLCVIWLVSGKMGDWPVNGMVVFAAWLPLQVWHAAAGRTPKAVVTDPEPGAAADGGI